MEHIDHWAYRFSIYNLIIWWKENLCVEASVHLSRAIRQHYTTTMVPHCWDISLQGTEHACRFARGFHARENRWYLRCQAPKCWRSQQRRSLNFHERRAFNRDQVASARNRLISRTKYRNRSWQAPHDARSPCRPDPASSRRAFQAGAQGSVGSGRPSLSADRCCAGREEPWVRSRSRRSVWSLGFERRCTPGWKERKMCKREWKELALSVLLSL